MLAKLHKLYADKVDSLLSLLEAKFLPEKLQPQDNDIFKLNIESLIPQSFADFNSSTNSMFTVFCDEEKLENYTIKLRNINATISSNKDIYNLLYTTSIKEIKITTFFLSDEDVYIDEIQAVTFFKERALEYILLCNKLKESQDSRDQLNYLRLTNFTNNLNDTVCSLLKLQMF